MADNFGQELGSLDFENILDFSHINDLDSRIITIYSGRHPG